MNQTEQKPRGDLAALKIERDDEPRGPVAAARIGGWIAALVILAAIGWLAYAKWIAPRTRPVVETITVKPSVLVANAPTLTVSGYLVADKRASVAPKMSGRVVKLNFDVASRVRRGDVLAVLESDELLAQLRESEAALADAEREHRRQAAMFGEGVSSRSLLDSAVAQRDIARARVERIRVVLRDMVVRAPFDGTVIAKNAEVGEVVAPISMGSSSGSSDGSIATIADLRTIEVEADVNESNLAQIRAAHPAEVTVDAFPGQKWRGMLRQIVPTADRAKGVVKVKVAIDAPSDRLLPDMSATVSFLEAERTEDELRETAKIWIPSSAIGNDDSGAFIVRVDENLRARRVQVQVGATREGRVEVVSGVSSGDRIVAKDPDMIEDGAAVRIAAP